MKKYLFALVFIACFFIENQVYADYFVPPPHTVPYTVNGHTYDQIVQQIWTSDLANDHMRQRVHYCNSHYFNVAKPILSAIDNSHNTFSLRIFTMDWLHMYNSDTDAFDYDLVMGNSLNDNQELCIFYDTADGGVTWTETLACLECMIYSFDLYGDFGYTDFIRSTFDLYWSPQPFVPSSWATNQFQDGLSRKTGRLIIPATSFGQASSTPLKFPFAAPATAYTAPVSSVMDQSTLGQGATYKNDTNVGVIAFNGSASNKTAPSPRSTCYGKIDNSVFNLGINYTGTTATGGKRSLCYDGHPGYDFPVPRDTNVKIFAPADGILCIASKTKTSKPATANVWRNPTYCPLPKEVGASWEGYHTLYIIHKGLIINGPTNDYMTVFLHNNDLSPEARAKIGQFGYVKVSTGSFIALVGKYSPVPIGPHIHLEVYKKNGTKWDRVDPYGDGIHNILWERK